MKFEPAKLRRSSAGAKCSQRAATTGLILALLAAALPGIALPASAGDDKEKRTDEKAAAATGPLLPIIPALPMQLGQGQAPPAELKKLKTPFNMPQSNDGQANANDPFAGFGLSGAPSPAAHPLSLHERLLAPTLFLPGHMVLGSVVQFTVKGKPGAMVALAMADKDTGAKPIFGHKVRLGSDRKVVAAGRIPANGVLMLNMETPVEGDLIGLCLYFEAAVWTNPDMSDTEFAGTVPSESQPETTNGVMIAAESTAKKHGIKIGPNMGAPIMLRQQQAAGSLGMESGKP
ncbi:MAG TPA: hypothetical protein V6C69_16360 [Trichormus sp.]